MTTTHVPRPPRSAPRVTSSGSTSVQTSNGQIVLLGNMPSMEEDDDMMGGEGTGDFGDASFNESWGREFDLSAVTTTTTSSSSGGGGGSSTFFSSSAAYRTSEPSPTGVTTIMSNDTMPLATATASAAARTTNDDERRRTVDHPQNEGGSTTATKGPHRFQEGAGGGPRTTKIAAITKSISSDDGGGPILPSLSHDEVDEMRDEDNDGGAAASSAALPNRYPPRKKGTASAGDTGTRLVVTTQPPGAEEDGGEKVFLPLSTQEELPPPSSPKPVPDNGMGGRERRQISRHAQSSPSSAAAGEEGGGRQFGGGGGGGGFGGDLQQVVSSSGGGGGGELIRRMMDDEEDLTKSQREMSSLTKSFAEAMVLVPHSPPSKNRKTTPADGGMVVVGEEKDAAGARHPAQHQEGEGRLHGGDDVQVASSSGGGGGDPIRRIMDDVDDVTKSQREMNSLTHAFAEAMLVPHSPPAMTTTSNNRKIVSGGGDDAAGAEEGEGTMTATGIALSLSSPARRASSFMAMEMSKRKGLMMTVSSRTSSSFGLSSSTNEPPRPSTLEIVESCDSEEHVGEDMSGINSGSSAVSKKQPQQQQPSPRSFDGARTRRVSGGIIPMPPFGGYSKSEEEAAGVMEPPARTSSVDASGSPRSNAAFVPLREVLEKQRREHEEQLQRHRQQEQDTGRIPTTTSAGSDDGSDAAAGPATTTTPSDGNSGAAGQGIITVSEPVEEEEADDDDGVNISTSDGVAALVSMAAVKRIATKDQPPRSNIPGVTSVVGTTRSTTTTSSAAGDSSSRLIRHQQQGSPAVVVPPPREPSESDLISDDDDDEGSTGSDDKGRDVVSMTAAKDAVAMVERSHKPGAVSVNDTPSTTRGDHGGAPVVSMPGRQQQALVEPVEPTLEDEEAEVVGRADEDDGRHVVHNDRASAHPSSGRMGTSLLAASATSSTQDSRGVLIDAAEPTEEEMEEQGGDGNDGISHASVSSSSPVFQVDAKAPLARRAAQPGVMPLGAGDGHADGDVVQDQRSLLHSRSQRLAEAAAGGGTSASSQLSKNTLRPPEEEEAKEEVEPYNEDDDEYLKKMSSAGGAANKGKRDDIARPPPRPEEDGKGSNGDVAAKHSEYVDPLNDDVLPSAVAIDPYDQMKDTGEGDGPFMDIDEEQGCAEKNQPPQEQCWQEQPPPTAIATAEPFDPALSKPAMSMRSKRRMWAQLCAVVIVVLLVALAVAIPLAMKIDEAKHPTPPAPAPTYQCPPPTDDYYRRLSGVSGESLCDPSSAQTKAYKWITDGDGMRLKANDANLRQRYILAVLYFSTWNGDQPWTSCDDGMNNGDDCGYFCVPQSQQALCDSEKCDCSVPNTEFSYDRCPCVSSPFLSSTHECEWYGIVCNEQQNVVGVFLSSNNLGGEIPPEIGQFDSLEQLKLPDNNIAGTLPPLPSSSFPRLTEFMVQTNRLRGTIPDGYYDIPKLEDFDLTDNCLTGTLSKSIGNLVGLKALRFSWNNFQGTLPSEILGMQNLRRLIIERNNFTGPLLDGLHLLPYLHDVVLARNSFTGTIPPSYGRINEGTDEYTYLVLFSNLLNGTVPQELFHVNQGTIDLSKNSLTGTLPSTIGEASFLINLRLEQNQLSGTLPTELGTSTYLEEVALEGNLFNGTMPASVCDKRAEYGALFPYLSADCLPGGDIQCDGACCTFCCSEITGQCEPTESGLFMELEELPENTKVYPDTCPENP